MTMFSKHLSLLTNPHTHTHTLPQPSESASELYRGDILLSLCYSLPKSGTTKGSLQVEVKKAVQLASSGATGASDSFAKWYAMCIIMIYTSATSLNTATTT